MITKLHPPASVFPLSAQSADKRAHSSSIAENWRPTQIVMGFRLPRVGVIIGMGNSRSFPPYY